MSHVGLLSSPKQADRSPSATGFFVAQIATPSPHGGKHLPRRVKRTPLAAKRRHGLRIAALGSAALDDLRWSSGSNPPRPTGALSMAETTASHTTFRGVAMV